MHKPMCATIRDSNECSFAAHKAQGGGKKDFKQHKRDVYEWYGKVPGLRPEIELLAWKHRGDTPLIEVSASLNDVDGRRAQITLIPRSTWEDDAYFFKTYSQLHCDVLRQVVDCTTFHQDEQYLLLIDRQEESGNAAFTTIAFAKHHTIRGAEIAEALRNCFTNALDLRHAFSWFMDTYPPDKAKSILTNFLERCALVYGEPVPENCVPMPSQGINNEVAYMILAATLGLEFEIQLVGLVGAAHLNGKQGVHDGEDPANRARFSVILDDGTRISVKWQNLVHIHRGDYKRQLL
jgi:hypothetical protein